MQRLLCGDADDIGSGMLPANSILETKKSRGVPGALDSILIAHRLGGVSRIGFKSFEQTRIS